MTHPSKFDNPCRYLITEVWGDMVGRVHCADVMVDDRRHEDDGTTTWILMTDITVTGGMAGHYIGPWEPPHQDAIDWLTSAMLELQREAAAARKVFEPIPGNKGMRLASVDGAVPDTWGQRTSANAYARARDLYESIQVLRKAQS